MTLVIAFPKDINFNCKLHSDCTSNRHLFLEYLPTSPIQNLTVLLNKDDSEKQSWNILTLTLNLFCCSLAPDEIQGRSQN